MRRPVPRDDFAGNWTVGPGKEGVIGMLLMVWLIMSVAERPVDGSREGITDEEGSRDGRALEGPEVEAARDPSSDTSMIDAANGSKRRLGLADAASPNGALRLSSLVWKCSRFRLFLYAWFNA